jgi:UTP--glucose-1-phosphate uridylyltransferase
MPDDNFPEAAAAAVRAGGMLGAIRLSPRLFGEPMPSTRTTARIPADGELPRVRHAVFPVAGLGARFLPATKACPKEMLPIVDRPLIQYAVEEAAAAGLTRMIFVTGRGKRAIEDHFDRAYELEHELEARADAEALRALRSAIPAGVTFSYVRQREPAGVLDALRRARPLLADAPFAVLLPDQLIDALRPPLAQLADVFTEQRVSVVGTQRVGSAAHDTDCFIATDLGTSTVRSARTLVKVPPIGAASAAVATCGRYVFTPAIWDALRDRDDATLVRSIRALMERERVFACLLDGRHFDCGSKVGFLEAQFAFAQKQCELWPTLQRRLGPLLADRTTRERGPATADTATTAAIMR